MAQPGLAHLHGAQVVGGSNPLVPTRNLSGKPKKLPAFLIQKKDMARRLHSTKSKLGQNFLVDKNILDQIVKFAEVNQDDVILEIGAGEGNLTRLLLETGCSRLYAVEIDTDLKPFLKTLEGPRLELIFGDAVKLDFTALAPAPNKVVANIPYHITTPLLWHILEDLAPKGLCRIIVMVQQEVARRLQAQPHSKERSPLGITLQAMGNVRTLRSVPPTAFRPMPKVNSAIVEMNISRWIGLANDRLWRRVLRASFSKRRKTLVNALSSCLPIEKKVLEELLKRQNLSPLVRPEDLSIEDWLYLRDKLEDLLLGGERKPTPDN